MAADWTMPLRLQSPERAVPHDMLHPEDFRLRERCRDRDGEVGDRSSLDFGLRPAEL